MLSKPGHRHPSSRPLFSLVWLPQSALAMAPCRAWAMQGIVGHPLSLVPALASVQLPPTPFNLGTHRPTTDMQTAGLTTPEAATHRPTSLFPASANRWGASATCRSPPPSTPQGLPSPPFMTTYFWGPPPQSEPSLPPLWSPTPNPQPFYPTQELGSSLSSGESSGSPGHRAHGPQPLLPNPALQAWVHSQTQPRSPLRVFCPPLIAQGPGSGGEGWLAGFWPGGKARGPGQTHWAPLSYSRHS